jgi:Delta14-sterol reductase
MALKKKSTATMLNPRTTAYEFFGPPGALFITLMVPITTYALYFGCSEQTGGCPPPRPSIVPNIIDSVGDPKWWKGLWDTQATVMYFAWYAICVVSWQVLPGDWVEGVTLRTGDKIKYKINGESHHLDTWANIDKLS